MTPMHLPPIRQWLIRLLLLLAACSGKEAPPPVYQVPAEVEPYVRKFTEEARRRGKAITITNLVVTFGPAPGADICGQCLPGAGSPNGQVRIVLSDERHCWPDATPEAREELVFHELGHCVLGRIAHRTDRLPNGDYASIMNGQEIGLYSSCVYDIGGTNNGCDFRYKRTYYLDELFREDTPVPAWAR